LAEGGFARLTERERGVLRFLACGHTVKSAAAEQAITENAANELLRSARRKLGVGSSREAARLFAGHEGGAPKTRDEKFGVPSSPTAEDIVAVMDKGTIAMIAAALAASANAPKVVSTTPANGAEIAPGPVTVSVTFDRPMAPRHYSFVRTDEGAFPDCSGTAELSADQRTYSMECVARVPGKHVIYFNKPPYTAFRDAATGTVAEAARLEFTVLGD
jgi:DNA-binding CsgD family transcriptional regulator